MARSVSLTKKQTIIDMLGDAFTYDEIRKKIEVKEATFDNYLENIREDNSKFLRHLAREGYQLNFQRSLRRLSKTIESTEKIIKRIDKFNRKNPGDVKMVHAAIQVNAIMGNLIGQQWALLNKAPMVASFNKFVQEHIVEKRMEPTKGIRQESISFM